MIGSGARVLCIAANPSIDRTEEIEAFRVGVINRPFRTLTLAGGKGLNVARAARHLGATVTVASILGGHAGRWIEAQLDAAGIETVATWDDAETRTCVTIVEHARRTTTDLYEPGAPIGTGTWDRFVGSIADRLLTAGHPVVTLSGSLPPGAPPDGYAGIVADVVATGATVILDATGEAGRLALDAHPGLVKVNEDEAASLTGIEIAGVPACRAAALAIRARSGGDVIVTRGELGAILVGRVGSWIARPAAAGRYGIGSGDAMAAGLALATARGLPPDEALALGMAAAAANAAVPGAGELDAATVEHLARITVVERIDG